MNFIQQDNMVVLYAIQNEFFTTHTIHLVRPVSKFPHYTGVIKWLLLIYRRLITAGYSACRHTVALEKINYFLPEKINNFNDMATNIWK
ncbi:hypothetical protein Xkoz_01881 [Xenorhabdus kozodoii]|uniref:Uncharacterized protein n=1 Tax=Xenorhabdus kozodoii TaxID=351676 RepID=A0A2D0LCZ9_9GAMM|nr:hypothetical protein Xkoz_01881 [Xenorhabdus kozodoii]